MRYRLRTLMIVLAIGPPVLALIYWLATTLIVWHPPQFVRKGTAFTPMTSDLVDLDQQQATEN